MSPNISSLRRHACAALYHSAHYAQATGCLVCCETFTHSVNILQAFSWATPQLIHCGRLIDVVSGIAEATEDCRRRFENQRRNLLLCLALQKSSVGRVATVSPDHTNCSAAPVTYNGLFRAIGMLTRWLLARNATTLGIYCLVRLGSCSCNDVSNKGGIKRRRRKHETRDLHPSRSTPRELR